MERIGHGDNLRAKLIAMVRKVEYTSTTRKSRTDYGKEPKAMPGQILDVDPRTLHVPPSRPQGADPFKLQTQIARFGASSVGMPLIWVYRGTDNKLMIWNGVTRATRIAKLAPGTTVRVEVIGNIRYVVAKQPTIGDLIP